ncbi:unnamed protein product [Orchesella dallaii]|uniref:Uncharacterized protein n=1 Tax=Orchesella dallaii TaxID=48710 RepID=A0ABP1PKH1_9HEXA
MDCSDTDPNSDQPDLNQIIDQVLLTSGMFATGDTLPDFGGLGLGIQNEDRIPVLGIDGQEPPVPSSSFRNLEQFIDPNAPPDYEGLPYMDPLSSYCTYMFFF